MLKRLLIALSIVISLVGVNWALTSITAYKTFTREVLTSSDLNQSFSRLVTGINSLIALHPQDSTVTAVGAHDTLSTRVTGKIVFNDPLISKSSADSVLLHLANIQRVNADSLYIAGQPIVGFSFGVTAGQRARIAYLSTDTLLLGGSTITSTADELNKLDGVTSTTNELNILTGVTSTAGELNALDGITSDVNELNKLDGVTSDTNELNILDGVTSTAGELNRLDGLTSSTAELNILTGVTSTAGELNKLDGYTGTAANLTSLIDDSMTDGLHRHSELSASDGAPAGAITVDATGNLTLDDQLGIGTAPSYDVHYVGAESAGGDTPAYGTVWFQDFTSTTHGDGAHQAHSFITYKSGANDFESTAPGISSIAVQVGDKSGATGTVTHAAAIEILDGAMPGGAVFTNKSGLYIAEQTGGTNNYAIYALGDSYLAGNVGIGTAEPEHTLHVKAATTVLKLETTDDEDSDIIFKTGSSGMARVGVDFQDSKSLKMNASGSMADDHLVVAPTGNVGIGKVPLAWHEDYTSLQIGGNGAINSYTETAANGYFEFMQNVQYDTSGEYEYIFTDEAARYRQYNGTHLFGTAPSGTAGNTITFTDRMAITSDGIGIGTTGPDLISNSSFPNVLTLFGSETGNDKASLEIASRRSGAASEVGRLSFWNTEAAGARLIAGISAFTGDSGTSYATERGQLGFYTTTTASTGEGVLTERMRINSNGNVGIGTAAPIDPLHVIKSGSATTGVQRAATFSYMTSGTAANDLASRVYLGVERVGGTETDVAAITAVLTDASSGAPEGSLQLGVRDTYEALTIEYGGNVGIGVTDPLAKLHVETAAVAQTPHGDADEMVIESTGNMGLSFLSSASGTAQIVFGTPDNNWLGDIHYNHYTDMMQIGAEGVHAIHVLGGAEVGIGTLAGSDGTLHVHTNTAGVVTADSDADDLVVENNDRAGISILSPDAYSGKLIFGTFSDKTGTQLAWYHNDDLFLIGTANAAAEITINSGENIPAVRIDASGNVGIGTEDPDHLLELASGATYSEIDAGETSFTVSSHSSFKENFAEVDEAEVVKAFMELPTPKRYTFKRSMFEDSNWVAAQDETITDEAMLPEINEEMAALRYARRDSSWKVTPLDSLRTITQLDSLPVSVSREVITKSMVPSLVSRKVPSVSREVVTESMVPTPVSREVVSKVMVALPGGKVGMRLDTTIVTETKMIPRRSTTIVTDPEVTVTDTNVVAQWDTTTVTDTDMVAQWDITMTAQWDSTLVYQDPEAVVIPAADSLAIVASIKNDRIKAHTKAMADYNGRLDAQAGDPKFGLMAEDFHEIAKMFQPDANPESLNIGQVVNALVIVVQNQDARIEALEKRVSDLERR